ncbi:MAG TPA: hypothetical protein VE441_11705 [Mycobacterium sp.]|nr:hypothetical protein [Mycobacterium sp.]
MWWLIGAAVLALVVTIVLVVRNRRRRRDWTVEFAAATREVTWFTRELVPQLEQAPTAAQIAGGWRMEGARVVAVEDRLTTLEASAADDERRHRVRTLRDAVRAARTRLAALDTTTDTGAARDLLRSAALEVELALVAASAGVTGGRHATGYRS